MFKATKQDGWLLKLTDLHATCQLDHASPKRHFSKHLFVYKQVYLCDIAHSWLADCDRHAIAGLILP